MSDTELSDWSDEENVWSAVQGTTTLTSLGQAIENFKEQQPNLVNPAVKASVDCKKPESMLSGART